MRKYCLIAELLIFKYRWQNISVSNTATSLGDFFTFQQDNVPAHRARETVQLLTCETPDFIAPALWPANSPDLNPVGYQIGRSCRSVCVAAWFVTLTWSEREDFHKAFFDELNMQWRHIFTSLSLHSSTRRTFWTQTWLMFDICTDVHFDSHTCISVISYITTCGSQPHVVTSAPTLAVFRKRLKTYIFFSFVRIVTDTARTDATFSGLAVFDFRPL